MWKLSVLLVCVQALLVVLAEEKSTPESAPQKESPATEEDGDLDEVMDSLGWCREDRTAAGICIACAQLPGVIAVPPGECCTEEEAFLICKRCVDDPLSCLRNEIEIEQGDGMPLDEEQDIPDKRFGMLFLGQKPRYGNEYRGTDKRFGTLNLGSSRKRSEDDLEDDVMDKRWGSLGLSTGKRYGMLGMGNPYLGYLSKGYGNMAKRFGTLNMGGGRHRFAKRFGTLFVDKKWGTLNLAKKRDLQSEAEMQKRYGTLSLGKRYGSLGMGSGFSSPTLGKRYGTLSMGYGYYPHKRSEYVPYNGNIGIDMRKRYGRLFMGRIGGKRLGTANEIQISEIKK